MSTEETMPSQTHSSTYTVIHCRRQSNKKFDVAIKDFRAQLGNPTRAEIEQAATGPDPNKDLGALEGSSKLMIFNELDFGAALPSFVAKKSRGKQFLIGNPLTADRMIPRNHEVALYVPLRIFILELDNGAGTAFIYDLPSSFLGQWKDPEILKVAKELDEILRRIVDGTLG